MTSVGPQGPILFDSLQEGITNIVKTVRKEEIVPEKVGFFAGLGAVMSVVWLRMTSSREEVTKFITDGLKNTDSSADFSQKYLRWFSSDQTFCAMRALSVDSEVLGDKTRLEGVLRNVKKGGGNEMIDTFDNCRSAIISQAAKRSLAGAFPQEKAMPRPELTEQRREVITQLKTEVGMPDAVRDYLLRVGTSTEDLGNLLKDLQGKSVEERSEIFKALIRPDLSDTNINPGSRKFTKKLPGEIT